MGRVCKCLLLGLSLLALGGCMTSPLLDNPMYLGGESADNPVYVPLGPNSYSTVFEHVLDVVDDYFEIAYSNRFDGQIETFPKVAPGVGQPWKLGSPDFYQRLYATFQSVRHRAIIKIQPAENDGYFISVEVYKELEDIPQPSHATAGAATYRSEPTLQRQYEVLDVGFFDSLWIPIGRDTKLEQKILDRIGRMDLSECTP